MNLFKDNALDTNIVFGTTLFGKEVHYRVQNVNLPGIDVAHPEIGNKRGAKIFDTADDLNYTPLSITVIVDEKLNVWKEFISMMHDMIDPTNGKLKQVEGDSYINITDSQGNPILNVFYRNTKLESVGELAYSTINENNLLVLDITVKYDYFEIEKEDTLLLDTSNPVSTTEADAEVVDNLLTGDVLVSKTDDY